jgi:MinD-like ATPase involved in chromosome partitioning or flagellar assembly/uncharacterized protein YjbI with pentapeptide repeats
MEHTNAQPDKTEIIALASGKGGTGKTLIASCLGYALIRGGQRVLMIDGDPATDGLSLFLLGPKGTKQISTFEPKNTFTGILSEFQNTGSLSFESRTIHRTGPGDHGIPYEAIISGRGLYGDDPSSTTKSAVPDLEQSLFRAGLKTLFQALRESGKYDYILVDTRGGFAFESTDVCALADSFIVVTEPDVTSFYQDRNLVRRISQAAREVNSPGVLRALLVNKATDGVQQPGVRLDLDKIEKSFRLELTKEFPVLYENTHPIPVDIEALLAYKTQNIPYTAAPASLFSFATLSAFSDILQVVTSRWSGERVEQWNRLVYEVSAAVAERNRQTQEKEQAAVSRENELAQLRLETAAQQERFELLQRERDRMEKAFDRELERSKALYSSPERSANKEERYTKDVEEYWLQRDRRRRRFTKYAVAIVAALLTALAAVAIPAWRVYHSNDLLTKAYDKNLPPALRSQDINDLVNSYHHQQFDRIDLDGVDLSSSRLVDVSFRSSSLVSANLSGADLKGATFVSANLAGADLSRAILLNANLTNANLTGTNLSGADLTGSRVTREQIKLAIVNEATRLPADVLSDAGIPAASVSIQFNGNGNPGLPDLMEQLTVTLRNTGLTSPDIEEIDTEYANTVRYFNKEDEPLAERVKKAVEDFMRTQSSGKYKDFSLETQYIFWIKPTPPEGQIEVWCNPKNKTKVGPTVHPN